MRAVLCAQPRLRGAGRGSDDKPVETDAAEPLKLDLPQFVAGTLRTLTDAGHEAAVVGGSLRDILHGDAAADWDLATAATPEEVTRLFPDARWENPFGTVTLAGPPRVEITTYRSEGSYRDRRRPDVVRWGSSLTEDLSRRDFTINAVAWRPRDVEAGIGDLVDPYGGRADLQRRVLRTVGDPELRLLEDALRLLRAVRFAARFELRIEAATEDALRRHAPAAAELSGERVRDELLRILSHDPPSDALRLMERLGLLTVLLPELAALRGVEQRKSLPGDALEHSLRTVDALPGHDPILRLTGLLHDVGKASTGGDGHFLGHETVGAELAGRIADRLRLSRADAARVSELVRHHMFAYRRDWTDAAVRRFIRRVGRHRLRDLFSLRRADNAASGTREPLRGGIAELERRVAGEIASSPLRMSDLAMNGTDIARALEIGPGPEVGRVLRALTEAVLDDPALNTQERLTELARTLHRGGDSTHRTGGGGRRASA